jgi:hypothetical protein
MMRRREARIGELVERLREKSHGFTQPPIIVVGGYALRAYVPIARYSRDCDFAISKGKAWNIDRILKWLNALTVEAVEKADAYGYLRVVQLVSAGKAKIKIALDFMEGEIRGRRGEGFVLDGRFFQDSTVSEIQIADRLIAIRVPSYQDYFLLKLLSGRPSDVRDIVAMVWKRGLPEIEPLVERATDAVNRPRQLTENLDVVLQDLSDARFLDSWRGTFLTQEFTEVEKKTVLKKLAKLRKAWS